MKVKHVFLRRMSVWTLLGTVVVGLILVGSCYLGMNITETTFRMLITAENSTSQGQSVIQKYIEDLHRWKYILLPAYGLVIGFMGLFFRWVLGRSFKKHMQIKGVQKDMGKETPKPLDQAKEKIIYKVDKNRERLLYSHLLAAFQREGQWIDFLKENLELYEDEQIGAAVRNIQENCKKVLDAHIQLKPVLKEEQGEEIVLEEGFSPDTVKLVGNVHGSPPFKGVVRHKGWKIHKVDIPDFSGEQNLEILAPAEVELV